MDVDEDVVDLPELAQGDLDLGECRAARPQVEVAAEVDDAQAQAVMLDHAGAAAGLAAEEVGRPHDPFAAVQIRVDLTAVIGVVSERDRVDARGEHLLGVLRRDPQPPGGVLAVDDDERRLVALAEHGQAVQQRLASQAADDIADEQDPRRRGRLSLSHTGAMVGGR